MSGPRLFRSLYRLAEPHFAEAEQLFRKKRRNCRTNAGIWSELVYCILAGTQVPVEQAVRTHSLLTSKLGSRFDPKHLLRRGRRTAIAEVASIARESGYRYHRTKARTIVAAAEFVSTREEPSLKHYLSTRPVAELVAEVEREIDGVGQKIANHWLRNVGKDTCTIDIHLRRLLIGNGVLTGDIRKPLSRQEFALGVETIRRFADQYSLPIADAQFALWLGVRPLARRRARAWSAAGA